MWRLYIACEIYRFELICVLQKHTWWQGCDTDGTDGQHYEMFTEKDYMEET